MIRGRRPGRRRRLLLAALATPAVALAAVVGVFAAWLHGVDVPVLSGETYLSVHRLAAPSGVASFTPAPDGPVFIAVIGNDERPGLEGARGDSLHVIGVNPQLGQATILGFPRDLGVDIPGHGNQKINAANALGGAELSARTLGRVVGVDIAYAVETNFDGFIGMLDELGPITVQVPAPMFDRDSGADFDPGPNEMSGERALAFSRDRKSFPSGDIARSENQGLVILAALAKVRGDGGGPAGTFRALAVLGRHTHLEGMGVKDLYTLGRVATAVDPANVRNVVVPVGSGSGTNLRLLPQAAALLDDFRDDGVLQAH